MVWIAIPWVFSSTVVHTKAQPLLFHVAPMQCYTNVHLRVLLRSLSTKAVLWTEMEKAADLCKSDKACATRLFYTQPEHPLVLQLGGSDLEVMAQAARRARPFAFDELSINCGCPSIEAGGADFGATLMLKPALTRQLAEKIAEACPGVPVSVKCRLGVHNCLDNTADQGAMDETYEELHSYVRQITSSGVVSHVIVHARAAVLSGLSPAQNRRVPPLRPEWVAWLASDFPNLRLTVNGGVEGIAGVRDVACGASVGGAGKIDGVMAGRWILRRPLDLWNIDAEPHIRTATSTHQASRRAQSRADAVARYLSYADRCLSKGSASAVQLLPPLLLVVEQMRDDLRASLTPDCGRGCLKDEAVRADEISQLLAVLWEGIPTLAPKSIRKIDLSSEILAPSDGEEAVASVQRLSKALGKAIGTKVANKLARNRAEQPQIHSQLVS